MTVNDSKKLSRFRIHLTSGRSVWFSVAADELYAALLGPRYIIVDEDPERIRDRWIISGHVIDVERYELGD